MENGEVSKRANILPSHKNLDKRQRRSTEPRSMKRKCLANARERILHHRGTSRILNSTRFLLSLFIFVTVSLYLFLFSSIFLRRIHDFFPLLVPYMSDSNESVEIHAIEIENDETQFHSRNAGQFFHRCAKQHLSSKIKYCVLLYRTEKIINPWLKVCAIRARRLNNSVNRCCRQLASARAHGLIIITSALNNRRRGVQSKL